MTAGGFWSDERRWNCGLADAALCSSCGSGVGSELHFFSGECEAVASHLTWERIAGRVKKTPRSVKDPGLAPLVCMCLPPRATSWSPVAEHETEGALSQLSDLAGGMTFGDGSGYRQNMRDLRISAWASLRLSSSAPIGGETVAEGARGLISGYFPTVQRAELYALVFHLRHEGVDGTYVGDCQNVIDTARNGVPDYHVSSRCLHADLWKEVRAEVMDRGGRVAIRKVKAHRSREQAEEAGEDARVWEGNQQADHSCKALAKSWAAADVRAASVAAAHVTAREIISQTITVATWAFRSRPRWARGAENAWRDGCAIGPRGDGGHKLAQIGRSKWRCLHCRREAWDTKGRLRLVSSHCGGEVAAECHPSHEIDCLNGVVWCRRCAAYATRQPRRLKQECPRRPMSEAAINVRRRLMQGLPPTTAKYLASISETWRDVACDKVASSSGENIGAPPVIGADDLAPLLPPPADDEVGRPASDADAYDGDADALCDRLEGDTMGSTGEDLAQHQGLGAGAGVATSLEVRIRQSRYRHLDTVVHGGIEPAVDGLVPQVVEETAASRNRTGPSSKMHCWYEPPRGRPMGKQSMAGGLRGQCTPLLTSAWTARTSFSECSVARRCNICNAPCRILCKRCDRPLCVVCARAQRVCSPA